MLLFGEHKEGFVAAVERDGSRFRVKTTHSDDWFDESELAMILEMVLRLKLMSDEDLLR